MPRRVGNRDRSHLEHPARQVRVYVRLTTVTRDADKKSDCVECYRNTTDRVPVMFKGKRCGWASEWKISRPFGQLLVDAWVTVGVGMGRLVTNGDVEVLPVGCRRTRRVLRVELKEWE